jgi:hypothetical protein
MMKRNFIFLIVILPFFIHAQIELSELCNIEHNFPYADKINFQIIDSFDDEQQVIALSGIIETHLVVFMYSLNGDLICNAEYELGEEEYFYSTTIFKKNGDYHVSYFDRNSRFILYNISNQIAVQDVYISDEEGNLLPFDLSTNRIKVQTYFYDDELFFILSGRSLDYQEGGGYYWEWQTPQTFIFDSQLDCIASYENCDNFLINSNLVTGIKRTYFSDHGDGNASYTSWIYAIEENEFPFVLSEWREINEPIFVVSSDHEINANIGFVYSTYDMANQVSHFFCIFDNQMVWENERESFQGSNATNVFLNEQNCLFVIGHNNKIMVLDHDTGEIIHTETLDLHLLNVYNLSDENIILVDFGYAVLDIYEIDSINFQVSTDENNLPQANSITITNFPNPFNPTTTILFSGEFFAPNEQITIEIYNIKGQKIRQFNIQNSELKINKIVWNGNDESGKTVSSGVYLYQIKSVAGVLGSKKMILMK